MHEISSYELFITKSDLSAWFSGLFAAGTESRLCISYRDDTAVGDSDLIRVSPEVFDGVAKTIKSLFDVRALVFFVQ